MSTMTATQAGIQIISPTHIHNLWPPGLIDLLFADLPHQLRTHHHRAHLGHKGNKPKGTHGEGGNPQKCISFNLTMFWTQPQASKATTGGEHIGACAGVRES